MYTIGTTYEKKGIVKNMEIERTYQKLHDTLTEIVRSPEDAYWIIWLNIDEIIHQSNLGSSADCLGTLMGQIMGMNKLATNIDYAFCNQSEEYQRIMKKYRFGRTLNEWGDFWKGLVREEKPYRLKRLWGVLYGFNDVLLPYCYDFVSKWEQEQEPDITYLPKDREKKYRKYRSMIKKMQETILTVNDVLQMVGGTEDVL